MANSKDENYKRWQRNEVLRVQARLQHKEVVQCTGCQSHFVRDKAKPLKPYPVFCGPCRDKFLKIKDKLLQYKEERELDRKSNFS